jgi:hypothetical protein
LERLKGIEPLSSAWKAEVIPLYDNRMAPRVGIEPTTLWLTAKCSAY